MPSTDNFVFRHIGPRGDDIRAMCSLVGVSSLDELTDLALPEDIRPASELQMPAVGPGLTEREVLAELRRMADANNVSRSYMGMGYHGTVTPNVLLRNIVEDPRWYTPYTPYQAEVSQGRLEALLNYQTMVIDLTGLALANSSLLDEATAAAEAMTMCHALHPSKSAKFFVDAACHPQTIAVVETRAEPIGIEVVIGDAATADFSGFAGVLLQYPNTYGHILDYRECVERAHQAGALAVVAADILSLALLTPPGELGADIAVGSTQRFGVPLGYGGPHAAYFATKDEYKRHIPGRLVGVSKDAEGRQAVRLALQTREQHIRRDRATSNICTAQVLLAVLASMYAVYHGPEGIKEIAGRVSGNTERLRRALQDAGLSTGNLPAFDTLRVQSGSKTADILARAEEKNVLLREVGDSALCVTLDETVTESDLADLVWVFTGANTGLSSAQSPNFGGLTRTSEYLTHPVFNQHRSETEMLRYLNQLQAKDISLAESMIPLGSCTMKLNATAEMIPVTWPGFNNIHPFAPSEHAAGYREMIHRLERMLAEITGFPAISLQPNAGSQGEYAGLLVIRKYHESRNETHRNTCLIPLSAHGTNPASAALAGMKIVTIRTDDQGNIDVADLRLRAEEHRDDLSCLMITYPSTHGVFEEEVREICDIVHRAGGLVYMDGANMNAQVGLCRPGDFGPDVCHLNLHKTFCIPHGGGGPGMGPIGVTAALAPFLPGHPIVPTGGEQGVGAVSAAPYGSSSILPISYAYIRMMGVQGLRLATQVAILNANYIAKRLEGKYDVLYKGARGLVAHECILDCRPFKASAGVEIEDIAKRLMDYGFHAPTVSFPVPGTLMVEPTESESKAELDRFCDAMIAIQEEVEAIAQGRMDRADNPLKNAPHTVTSVVSSDWKHSYTREQAAFPAPWLQHQKYWPPVARIDSVYGDRNVVCSCPPIEEYASE